MDLEIKSSRYEIKELDDLGSIKGYASVFGVCDDGGDIVHKDAFLTSLEKSLHKMLCSHRAETPIGTWLHCEEDERGLWVDGQLNLEVQKAREIHSLLRSKSINGLSIGYRVVNYDLDHEVRHLTELDLLETSIVTFPMNRSANISAVKNAISTPIGKRDLEGYLIQYGYSRREAKRIVAAAAEKASANIDEEVVAAVNRFFS